MRFARERILRQEYRIKELEQLLCPGGVHEFKCVDVCFEGDESGGGREIKKFVCQRCLRMKRG